MGFGKFTIAEGVSHLALGNTDVSVSAGDHEATSAEEAEVLIFHAGQSFQAEGDETSTPTVIIIEMPSTDADDAPAPGPVGTAPGGQPAAGAPAGNVPGVDTKTAAVGTTAPPPLPGTDTTTVIPATDTTPAQPNEVRPDPMIKAEADLAAAEAEVAAAKAEDAAKPGDTKAPAKVDELHFYTTTLDPATVGPPWIPTGRQTTTLTPPKPVFNFAGDTKGQPPTGVSAEWPLYSDPTEPVQAADAKPPTNTGPPGGAGAMETAAKQGMVDGVDTSGPGGQPAKGPAKAPGTGS